MGQFFASLFRWSGSVLVDLYHIFSSLENIQIFFTHFTLPSVFINIVFVVQRVTPKFWLWLKSKITVLLCKISFFRTLKRKIKKVINVFRFQREISITPCLEYSFKSDEDFSFLNKFNLKTPPDLQTDTEKREFLKRVANPNNPDTTNTENTNTYNGKRDIVSTLSIFFILSGIFVADFWKECKKVETIRVIQFSEALQQATLNIAILLTTLHFLCYLTKKFKNRKKKDKSNLTSDDENTDYAIIKLVLKTDLPRGLVLFIMYHFLRNYRIINGYNICASVGPERLKYDQELKKRKYLNKMAKKELKKTINRVAKSNSDNK